MQWEWDENYLMCSASVLHVTLAKRYGNGAKVTLAEVIRLCPQWKQLAVFAAAAEAVFIAA